MPVCYVATPGVPPYFSECWFGGPALGQGRMNRSTALAKPSSSLVVVIRRAARLTSSLALPMAMLSPDWANMRTSLGMSPIVAISSGAMS